ncbi:MAG: hypothetical protein ACJ8H8_31260 [Geminicoccaceae bacterium]
MSYTVTAVGPQVPTGGYHVVTLSAKSALGMLAAYREAYGPTMVRDAAGLVVDMDELVRRAELEAGETQEGVANGHAEGAQRRETSG